MECRSVRSYTAIQVGPHNCLAKMVVESRWREGMNLRDILGIKSIELGDKLEMEG